MTVIELPPLQSTRILTEDDLPCSDGIPMDNERQRLQMNLLIETLQLEWKERQDAYVGGNMFIYFSSDQLRTEDFRGPDVFAAVDVVKRERKSWVVWNEGKAPDVLIEVLSPSTELEDRTTKKAIYQDRLQAPEYYWHDPFDRSKFSGFHLERGVYVPVMPDTQGRLHSQRLGLLLALWDGVYDEIEACWLRWARPDGTLLPTKMEISEQERGRAEQERRLADQERGRADQERDRADRLAAMLKAMGVDPGDV